MIITEGTYVDKAEDVIKRIKKMVDQDRRKKMVTTSKMRNLLAMTSDIYNEVLNEQSDQLEERLIERIEYLRIRFVYEAGRSSTDRNDTLKDLIEMSQILDILKEINGSKKNFILFNRYVEALVAFRKYYGGRDE